MTKPSFISVIVPMYNEAAGIAQFYREICAVLHKLPDDFELVFVDDGSSDESAALVAGFKKTRNVTPRLLQLARNFGKEAATSAGLAAAEGNAALMIDADLQHPVTLIPQFIEKWRAGADVVVGVRRHTASDSLFKRIGSNAFYRFMNRWTRSNITPHATDFRLIDRIVIDQFNRFTERNRMTRSLIDWLGFSREYVEFDAQERRFGQAAYDSRRLFNLAVDTFVASTTRPLRLFAWLGLVLTLLSGAAGLFVIVEQFVMDDPLGLRISGSAMLALVLLFVCGVILMSLGIMSLYIGSMYSESLGRPLYVLKRPRQSER